MCETNSFVPHNKTNSRFILNVGQKSAVAFQLFVLLLFCSLEAKAAKVMMPPAMAIVTLMAVKPVVAARRSWSLTK